MCLFWLYRWDTVWWSTLTAFYISFCVRADLGSTRVKILFLAGLYFICVGLLRHSTYFASDDDSLSRIIRIPTALLDVFFYWWICLSLMRTISQLTIRRQPLKLEMYKTFFLVLLVSFVLRGVVIVWQLWVTFSYNTNWFQLLDGIITRR